MTDIGYGHRIESYDDEFFSVGERFIKYGAAATTPTLLDIHPICKPTYFIDALIIGALRCTFLLVASLPSWAPGAWFVNFIKGAYL